jgi:hypothetical protein
VAKDEATEQPHGGRPVVLAADPASARTGEQTKMKNKKRIILVIAIVIIIFIADGFKSYFVARLAVAHLPNLECTRVLFVGVWFVSFKYGGARPGSVANFTVAPLLPWMIEEQYCR